jgi:hypothetical protein
MYNTGRYCAGSRLGDATTITAAHLLKSPSMRPLENLPPEITTQQTGDSVRFILPLRDLKYGKWIAGALLIVGLLVIPCTIFTLYSLAASFFNLPAPAHNRFGGVAFFFCVFGAPLTWGGFAPLWWGIVSFWGHREIEVNRDYLLTVERCGPFWRSKRWRVENIGSFQIRPLSNSDEPPPPIDLAAEFNALVIHPRSGKQGMVAWGYSIALLNSLAAALVDRCNQAAEVKGFANASQEEREVIYYWGAGAKTSNLKSGSSDLTSEDELDEDLDEEDWEDDTDAELPATRPPTTTIRFDSHESGDLTITIPPAGLIKGSKGLFLFGLIWSSVMTLFTSLIILAVVNNPKQKNDMPWFGYAIFGLFWLIGIGLLLSGINMGRRRAAIALVSGQLMAIQTGIFGSKKREWPLEELAEIRVGPSGMEVNKQPINELQIVDKKNSKFGLLSERNDAELRWLASELKSRCLPT